MDTQHRKIVKSIDQYVEGKQRDHSTQKTDRIGFIILVHFMLHTIRIWYNNHELS